jgi:hypothetical protein
MKASTLAMVKRSRTNFPGLERSRSGRGANELNHEMCPIHRDFKHFCASKAEDFRHPGKVPSIMQANVLSIMRADHAGLTSLFKPKRPRLWHALTHRPGT